MSSLSANEDCLGWAARDASGFLSPYSFDRRYIFSSIFFRGKKKDYSSLKEGKKEACMFTRYLLRKHLTFIVLTYKSIILKGAIKKIKQNWSHLCNIFCSTFMKCPHFKLLLMMVHLPIQNIGFVHEKVFRNMSGGLKLYWAIKQASSVCSHFNFSWIILFWGC